MDTVRVTLALANGSHIRFVSCVCCNSLKSDINFLHKISQDTLVYNTYYVVSGLKPMYLAQYLSIVNRKVLAEAKGAGTSSFPGMKRQWTEVNITSSFFISVKRLWNDEIPRDGR